MEKTLSMSVSKEELANLVMSDRPHVVILGAGASRATCPNGDKNGKKLPLMNDLVECLNLESKLKEWNINPNQNFEEIFSSLFENKEYEKTKQLEKIINEYFDSLRLPDKPTIYDHLVLSLRDKDFIASFNWDPLLLYAYHRNSNRGIGLPRLAFLHGNVRVGFCEEHKRVNYLGANCEQCKKPLSSTHLLYPIKKKNYSQDQVIKIQWDRLRRHIESAFVFTIFGYSGPKTDVEAISVMKEAWNENRNRLLNDTMIITTQNDDVIYEHWKPFFHSHHYSIHDGFYNSAIANYPRRTFEVSWQNNVEAKFVEENPIPNDLDFLELWKWYRQFTEAENKYRKDNPFPTNTKF